MEYGDSAQCQRSRRNPATHLYAEIRQPTTMGPDDGIADDLPSDRFFPLCIRRKIRQPKHKLVQAIHLQVDRIEYTFQVATRGEDASGNGSASGRHEAT